MNHGDGINTIIITKLINWKKAYLLKMFSKVEVLETSLLRIHYSKMSTLESNLGVALLLLHCRMCIQAFLHKNKLHKLRVLFFH